MHTDGFLAKLAFLGFHCEYFEGQVRLFAVDLDEVIDSNNTITIPEGIQILGSRCIDASNYCNLVLSSSVEKLEISCLGNGHFNIVHIPKTVKILEENSLETWVIRKLIVDCEAIKDYSFKEHNIEYIKINVSLTKLPQKMFSKCKLSRGIDLPDTIEVIEDSCFESSGLPELRLPKNCKSINNYVFRSSDITTLICNEKLCDFGTLCFGYSKISKIIGLENTKITKIPSYCFKYSNLTSLILPKSCKTIESSAFSYCDSLAELNFENIKRIDEYAFEGTDLVSVDLKSIEILCNSCFQCCYKLKEFIIRNKNFLDKQLKELGYLSTSFNDIRCTIYVPESFKENPKWSTIASAFNDSRRTGYIAYF